MKTEQEVIQFFLGKNILVSGNVVQELKERDLDEIYSRLADKINMNDFVILNEDLIKIIDANQKIDVNWEELDRAKTFAEKKKNPKMYEKFMDVIKEEPELKTEQIADETNIKITDPYEETEKKREIGDFVKYFMNRYNQIEKLLQGRQELQGLTSISRVLNKKDKESVSIIGIVNEKRLTKNNNYIITIEDPTGEINIIISKNKPDLFNLAKDLVEDEVIAINGTNSDKVVFVNTILHPDVPLSNELKKCPDEVYAIFLSDLHVGSDHFLEDEFNKFLKWINAEVGNETQKDTARKIKYIFIIGDLVDGVGVYPGQEDELLIKDIYGQYKLCIEYLKKIPKDKRIIICPGNHDAVRIAEPQPALPKDFTEELWQMPNVTMVQNPSYLNIHSSDEFSGFDVLMYHGYSFDYYAANVDSIRAGGGYDRADLIMKFLLQRRHLAPTHTSTLYIPETSLDPLVISKIPDFFVTGHIHKSSVSHYRNVTLISGSCFQSKTPFQEKVGHKPEPARVPIINMKTREVKILKF